MDLSSENNVSDCSLNASRNFVTAAAIEESAQTNTVLIAIFTALLSLVIVVGNGLIIVSVALVKKLRQPANYLIVSLALSDFLVGFIVLPLTIVYDAAGEWLFGPMVCDIHVSFDVICCTASIMNLCMISIDRYLMITKPLTYPKRRTGKLMLVMISTAWVLSALIIIPALFGFTKNVKDEPDWLIMERGFLLNNTDCLLCNNGSTDHPQTHPSYSAWAALDGNPETFWEPDKNTRCWQFVLDFSPQKMRVTRFSARNVDLEHDVLQYEILGGTDSGSWTKIQTIQLELNNTDAQEVHLRAAVEVQLLRVNVSETYNGNQPRLGEFRIYGEKIHGKTCLISQEVWFALYSTVGAFYLPLSVMLCMYWKIYVEASKFHARNRARTAAYGGSQEWTPQSTPCPAAMGRSRNRYVANRKKPPRTNNNNHSNLDSFGKTCDTSSESCDANSEEKFSSLANRADHKSQLTILIDETDSNCEENSENVFDDDTISSECDCLNVDHFDAESKPEMIPNDKGRRKLYSSNRNFNLRSRETCSANGNVGHNIRPYQMFRLRTCSTMSADAAGRYGNGGVVSPLARSSPSMSMGSDKNSSRECCAKSSKSSSSPELHTKISRSQDCIGHDVESSRNNVLVLTRSQPSKTLYTRLAETNGRKTPCQENGHPPRVSIFSGSAYRPLPTSRFRRFLSSGDSSQCAALWPASLPYKSNVSKKLHFTSSFSGISNGRRSTIFSQLRRRVSVTTSRERMGNVKATRTLGIVVGAFTFCWLPFFIVTFLRPFICENPESQDCIPLWLVRLVLWLGYLNSALNPFVYIGFSPDLREAFRLLICCKCTNVDRRLAQLDIRQAYNQERRASIATRSSGKTESIL